MYYSPGGVGAASDARASLYTAYIPIGRMGRKEEIAHLLLYLVSDLGSLITGQIITADGGQWMGTPNSMNEAMDRMNSYMNKSKM